MFCGILRFRITFLKSTELDYSSPHTEINFDEHKSNYTFIRFLHINVF